MYLKNTVKFYCGFVKVWSWSTHFFFFFFNRKLKYPLENKFGRNSNSLGLIWIRYLYIDNFFFFKFSYIPLASSHTLCACDGALFFFFFFGFSIIIFYSFISFNVINFRMDIWGKKNCKKIKMEANNHRDSSNSKKKKTCLCLVS